MVDGEDVLVNYGEDDWDCDAEEFEGESYPFEERHFVELSCQCMDVLLGRLFSSS